MTSPNDTRPLLSIVVETCNLCIASREQLSQCLEALCGQSYPKDRTELLVVVPSTNKDLATFLEKTHPACQIVWSDRETYYAMKMSGVNAAQGEFVAFVDSDCIPCVDWAESIVESLSAGFDVVAGKTRYSRHAWFSKTFSLFSFGHLRNDEHGEANGFIVNNCGFRTNVIRDHAFDDLEHRTGSGYTLSRKLKKLGFRITYNPQVLAMHYNHGLAYHLANRLRSGHEVIRLSQDDVDEVLADTRFLRFGVLAPFIHAIRRFHYDLKTLWTNHRDLGISRLAIPVHAAAAFLIRTLEVGTGIITVVSPKYLPRKYGW